MIGRVLGIDHGGKRIGLAITDPLRTIARPLDSIRNEGEGPLLKRLADLVREEEIVEIVIGLPLNMDGTEGPAARAARALAARLEEALGTPVHLEDERLTSVEADQVLREAEARGAERRRLQDRVAAQIILQDYLNRASGEAAGGGGAGDERPV